MSIRHIVMWKLVSEIDSGREGAFQELKTRLEGLVPLIPELRSLTVSRNVLFPGKNHDVVLEAVVDDAAGLDAYLTHPEHVAVVDFVKSVTSDRVAIDFEE